MPDKHPNTRRWGGPGASHEDATKPEPDERQLRPDDAVGSRPNVSQVSGGGGEQDEKHSHVDGMRSSKSHATDSPSPTSTRAWRKNRSRRDQARDQAAEETRTFESEPAQEVDVLVNTDDNIQGSDRLTQHVSSIVSEALRRFASDLTRVEVYLTDENASRTGGADKRCSVEVRPKGRAPLATSHQSDSLDEAVSGASAKMVRRLESEMGRRADARGRDTIRGAL